MLNFLGGHFGSLWGHNIWQCEQIGSLAHSLAQLLSIQSEIPPFLGIWGVLSCKNQIKSFFAIFCRFWASLSPAWALGFLKHLCKMPDVYIYPLAIASAKKTPLILNSFHSYSFSWVWFFSGQFDTFLGLLWTLAGDENSSKYDHIKLGPWFHPLTVRLAQKPSLFIYLNGFCRFSPSCGLFCSLCSFLGANKAIPSALTTSWGPHSDPRRC